MWKRSFVATAVALGDGVDDAVGWVGVDDLDARTTTLVEELRAPQRATRATALARAVRDIMVAVDEGTLR